MTQVPHPFPYQGSKRAIARYILPFVPRDVARLVEPFCGSAAVSVAAASQKLTSDFWLNDIDPALMTLWSWILECPEELTSGYEQLWNEQHPDRKEFFFRIRDEFNTSHQPHHLLYLLARIVKGSVRYSSQGLFNQSPDNRRSGMRPAKMRKQVLGVSSLLGQKTRLTTLHFRELLPLVEREDLVYLDPPYQGTSFTRDHRYYTGVNYDDLTDALVFMNDVGVSYILSYDGRTGDKSHGKPLPESLNLTHHDVYAGRSSQATLLGDSRETVESLYLSPALVQRLRDNPAEDVTRTTQMNTCFSAHRRIGPSRGAVSTARTGGFVKSVHAAHATGHSLSSIVTLRCETSDVSTLFGLVTR